MIALGDHTGCVVAIFDLSITVVDAVDIVLEGEKEKKKKKRCARPLMILFYLWGNKD